MGKKSLGRGLNAIFKDHSIVDNTAPEIQEVAKGESIIMADLTQIDPNPFQPRKKFNADDLKDLAESIREHGVLQPIILRKHDNRFQLVAGERRYRASQSIDLKQIPARVISSVSDKKMVEWALIENIQRVELSAIEEANSFEILINQHGYTHEKLAERLGKSRSAITNTLRLLKLPQQIQAWIDEGKLNAGAARSLLSPDISDPIKMAQKIMDNGLNVRQAETMGKKPASNKKIVEPDPNLIAMEKSLQYSLGTRVLIKTKPKGGQIQIEYNSQDDLGRIAEMISSLKPEF
jgi:ParB family chromosome partitioning protein